MSVQNQTNSPIPVALLGAGYIAEFHYTALRLLPQVEVKAICDLSRQRAEQFAQANSIPQIYTNLEEMLSSEPLQVVHVLTPPNIHYPTAHQVISAGVDVLIEKPLCHTVSHCQQLQKQAEIGNRTIGVSHNFLYTPVYERLFTDWRSGRLGQIDQLDIIWNKELGQLRGGPYGAWMLQKPQNILFEVAPHAFAYLVHLLGGQPESLTVDIRDRLNLPGGLVFYRRWEIRGWKGNTSIRIRLSFIDGYPEHYIHVRGTNAVARADIENNTYNCQEHIPQQIDLDRYANVIVPAWDLFWQGNQTLGSFVLSKLKLIKSAGGPFAESIARTVASFYAGRENSLDQRISPSLGEGAVAMAEWVAQEVELSTGLTTQVNIPVTEYPIISPPKSTVLVIGGTGFIGRSLVQHLCQKGHGVRVIARDPKSCPLELKNLGIEIIEGDFTDSESMAKAIDGMQYVYHLARGFGKTWSEYLKFDVEPTRKVAELCLEHGIKRFFYTSSIAIYDAGNPNVTINEETKPHSGVMRVNPYARSKVENERILMHLHQEKGLPVVIFRPAVVLGRGGSPYHWGVAAWPYNSVCRLWGEGNDKLPIVLVDDLAEAMLLALKAPNIEGQSFNLTSPPSITANEYLDELEFRAGIKLKRLPTQGWRYYIEALGKWAIKASGRDPNAAFPSYADGQGRSFASPFDASKAERLLGWLPTKDHETLIREGIHVPVDEFLW